jgi:biopolymer transport protein ExbB
MLESLLAAFAGPSAPFMYALLAVAAFAIAVAVERAWTFARAEADGAAVLEQLRKAGAVHGTTPLERVLTAGAQERDQGGDRERIWDAMTAAAIDAEEQLRARVNHLAAVASLATMIGLFGTVYGLMLSFGALGEAVAADRAARLSEGSATAMSTTAFGLLVAIPALAAHALAEARARRMLAHVEATATRALLVLVPASREEP